MKKLRMKNQMMERKGVKYPLLETIVMEDISLISSIETIGSENYHQE